MLLYLFVFDVWVVPRGPDATFVASILPTLMPEDKVLVRRGKAPEYGGLARCASPTSPEHYLVGRVFGLPGDRVEMTDNAIRTNGQPLGSRHGCGQRAVPHPLTENLVTMNCGVADLGAHSFEFLTHPSTQGEKSSVVVEAGKVYLVSDNRLMHQDSRDVGQIEASTCEHIVFRLWGEKYTDASRRFNVLW